MRPFLRTAAFLSLILTGQLLAQIPPLQDPAAADGEDAATPEEIALKPEASDPEIADRLTHILEATGWISDPEVEVQEGVVFLEGTIQTVERREQIVALAEKLQGVVAVVDQMELAISEGWDLSPVWNEFREIGRAAVNNSPVILLALLLLVVSWLLASLAGWGARGVLKRRARSDLLVLVIARVAGILVFLLGLYFVLKVLGLTRLAFTVLGGTGLFGLVLGFAFRDIAENFLASILLSVHNPFKSGDLVEVAGHTGYVQRVNSRSTVLMTLNGNHVQIPNATIYKATIVNMTANPLLRLDFIVGIGYADSISHAQDVALAVMRDHEAVLKDPEPLVLVESLGASTVNLRVYFWIDGVQHSRLKVASAIIRRTKRAFDEVGISMPDEARELVFPDGVPVRMIGTEDPAATSEQKSSLRPRPSQPAQEPETHTAEGQLESEAVEIENQARQSRIPEPGPNLLNET